MSKKKKQPKYFDPPTPRQMEDLERRIEEAKKAGRKKKKLKIEPYAATVSECLRVGKSSRNIVRIVWMQHKFKVSKASVLRFAKAHANNFGTDPQSDQTLGGQK